MSYRYLIIVPPLFSAENGAFRTRLRRNQAILEAVIAAAAPPRFRRLGRARDPDSTTLECGAAAPRANISTSSPITGAVNYPA